jgi:hypothetical protein
VPWNILLLPLLAGYYYCKRSNAARFKYRDADGNRLLLESAFHGVVFLLLATVATLALGVLAIRVSWLESITQQWTHHNPYPHLGKSLLSLILSWVVTLAVNTFSDEEKAKKQILEDENEAFELLLRRAVDKTRPLLLSLNDQRVYMAFSLDKVRIDRKHLRVIPLWSGYRKGDTQEVVFTTDYLKVYEELEKDPETLDDRLEGFELVIPAELVASATLFDKELYSEHFSAKNEPSAPATPSDPPAKS